jgi:hypothetical protein
MYEYDQARYDLQLAVVFGCIYKSQSSPVYVGTFHLPGVSRQSRRYTTITIFGSMLYFLCNKDGALYLQIQTICDSVFRYKLVGI